MFYCQSELASRRWLGLDLAGVSVGRCGCYFPGAYYAFYCDIVSHDSGIKSGITDVECEQWNFSYHSSPIYMKLVNTSERGGVELLPRAHAQGVK